MPTTTSTTAPPAYLQSYYEALAKKGAEAGNLGFTSYGSTGQDRIADFSKQQKDAANLIQAKAAGGSPALAASSAWQQNMLAGNNNVPALAAAGQQGNIANDYIGKTSTGAAASGNVANINAVQGPQSIASGGQSTTSANPYSGMDNPYLNQQIQNAMGDVSSQIDSRFKGNAFGGTAHQQTLARELGRVGSNMRMQDYGQQQGLAENAVNRDLSNQQYNIGNTNQLNQANANLGMQNAGIQNTANQFNAGLQGQNISNTNALNQFNATLGANDLARNTSATQALGQANANLGLSNIGNTMQVNQANATIGQNNVANQANAAAMAPTLEAAKYGDANNLMALGDKAQANSQANLDFNYQEFLRQQNQPGVNLGFMQQGLDPSRGATQTTTNTPTQGGSNTAANLLGGAASLYGGYKLFG